jgi:hypothetical protein
MKAYVRRWARKVPCRIWPRVAIGGAASVVLGLVAVGVMMPLLLFPVVGGGVAILVALYGMELTAPGREGA